VSDAITWLGTTEAAERLGVVPRTLYRMIDEGQIAAFKFGRVIRLKESDLDEFIESTRVQPGSLSHLYPERIDGA
jgi:excisionase family DNA binding protein